MDIITTMHLTAFKNHVNVKLGNRYIKSFLNWFIDNPKTIHFVAKGENNEIFGYVVGAPWGYQKKINKDLLLIGLLSIIVRPWVIFDNRILNSLVTRFNVVSGISKHIHDTQIELKGLIVSLVGIAVIDFAKGTGVASSLISSFEINAKELGYDVMRLSVYNKNLSARKFYEKEGWKIIPNTASKNICGYFKCLENKMEFPQ